MVKRLLTNILKQRQEERRAEVYRNLIRQEAKIGGKLFGEVPAGGNREFFSLDDHTLVWHEEWLDENGQHQSRTTRYDIRPDGILKSQSGGYYHSVTLEEAKRLQIATNMYVQKVKSELYGIPA